MREISRIQFKFSQKAFVDFWNAMGKPFIQYGIITLYKDSEEYAQLVQAFQSFYSDAQTWKELIEVEYTSADLERCEILSVWINGDVGLGGNHFSKVYQVSGQCTICGQTRIITQEQNLTLDSAPFTSSDEKPLLDFNRTDFNDEIVVSVKLRRLLQELKVQGIDFRSIYGNDSNQVQPIESWYQLIISNQTGLFAAPTQLLGGGVCNGCNALQGVQFDIPHNYLVSQASEPHFHRFGCDQHAIFLSTQKLQSNRHSVGRSVMIITRDLYLKMQQANITGFWVQPAYFV